MPTFPWFVAFVASGFYLRINSRVDAIHFSFSDLNSPLQGIPKYEIWMPCKVLGQSDQFVPGPHPP